MAYSGNLHINRALTNISLKYRNTNLIADDLLKSIPVKKETDLFYSYIRDFRIADTLRQNKAVANMEYFAVSTATYVLEEHALADVVTDRDRSNSDSIQVDIDTTEFLTDKILLTKEKDTADLLFTTGSWSGTKTLTTNTSWHYNTTTSGPILDVLSGTSYVVKNAMVTPNIMVLGHQPFVSLKENPNVYNRLAYTERKLITKDLLAAVFDLDEVYVGTSVYDAGYENGLGNSAGAESITSIWGTNALIMYRNPTISKRQITGAVCFEINPGLKTKKWREEKLAGDIIEVSTMFRPRVMSSLAGYYWVSVTNQ